MITREQLREFPFRQHGKELHLYLSHGHKRVVIIRGTWMFFVDDYSSNKHLGLFIEDRYVQQQRLLWMWRNFTRTRIVGVPLMDLRSIIKDVIDGWWPV